MGASAGGVKALQRVISALPVDLPAAIFVVLHMWPGAASLLPNILRRGSALQVAEAQDDITIELGRVYIAPPDLHLFVERGRIAVLRGPRENRTRPAINPLFRSAATAYGNRVIGVILSGTLDDGTAGLWAVKQSGGIAMAQSDAEFSEMPESARANVELDHYAPLLAIPALLDRLAREPVKSRNGQPPKIVQLNNDVAKMSQGPKFGLDEIGTRSLFSCPDCNGALWEVDEGGLQYRCHVGHAFSPEVLRMANASIVEQSLWSALRALKESAALDERLASRSAEHALEHAAAVYRANAQDKLAQAEHVQRFLASLRATLREDAAPPGHAGESNPPST